jgi:hypothetical protein
MFAYSHVDNKKIKGKKPDSHFINMWTTITIEAPEKPKEIFHKGHDPVKEQESASTP